MTCVYGNATMKAIRVKREPGDELFRGHFLNTASVCVCVFSLHFCMCTTYIHVSCNTALCPRKYQKSVKDCLILVTQICIQVSDWGNLYGSEDSSFPCWCRYHFLVPYHCVQAPCSHTVFESHAVHVFLCFGFFFFITLFFSMFVS